MFAVANRRKAGCGRITRFWSSSVSLPSTSSTRWITNITSGRPASYSSNTRAVGCLQRPGQQAFAVFGHLLAVAQDDGVLADEIDAADMAVQVDADAGPVEPRGDLLDMGRLAGAVIALDHDAAVVGKAGQDRQRGVVVEAVGLIHIRHMLGRLAEGRHLHVGIDAERLAHRNRDIGNRRIVCRGGGLGCHFALSGRCPAGRGAPPMVRLFGSDRLAGKFRSPCLSRGGT